MAVTDEEFASQVARYVASIPVSTFVRMKPGELTEPILAMAKEKGYEDGPRFVRYMKTPEGQALYMDTYKRELEARKRPARLPRRAEVLLPEEEKRRLITEFEEIMGREPTEVEKFELFAQELKKRKEVVV